MDWRDVHRQRDSADSPCHHETDRSARNRGNDSPHPPKLQPDIFSVAIVTRRAERDPVADLACALPEVTE